MPLALLQDTKRGKSEIRLASFLLSPFYYYDKRKKEKSPDFSTAASLTFHLHHPDTPAHTPLHAGDTHVPNRFR